jgi:hypothetical protein
MDYIKVCLVRNFAMPTYDLVKTYLVNRNQTFSNV